VPAVITSDHQAACRKGKSFNPSFNPFHGKSPMLVTFNSKAWSSVTLFGDVAVTLLKMMGHSGTVPGALRAAEIPAAIAQLQQTLAAAGPEEKVKQSVQPDAADPDAPPPVGLGLRAYPLIQLLSAAGRQDCDVLWDQGAPRI
jgi:hypothetical protein